MRSTLGIRAIPVVIAAMIVFGVGSGEHLFSGIDLPDLGFVCSEKTATVDALHVIVRRK